MWLDDLLDFWFPLPREKVADISDSEPCFGVEDIPLDIPEFYLRPELITTIREPDGAAVEEAQRVVRAKR